MQSKTFFQRVAETSKFFQSSFIGHLESAQTTEHMV